MSKNNLMVIGEAQIWRNVVSDLVLIEQDPLG
jgi:hypothetical protein